MATKTGKWWAAAVYIGCPHCDELLEGRSDGSQMISSGSGYQAGQVVKCPACGERFRIPRALANVGA